MSSEILLSKAAYQQNLEYVRSVIGPDTRFSSVIKANAYGHGIEPFVEIAEDAGVRHFAVFSAEEAYRMWEARSQDSGVMVMGWIDDGDELEWAIEQGVEFFVFDLNRLTKALAAAERIGRAARIHVEIETGLNRTGFLPEVFDQVIELLNSNTGRFVLEGICTHYAGAENWSNRERVQRQIGRYREALAYFRNAGYEPKYRHTACSAAALAYPETIMDMVRIGVAQYGFWPSPEIREHQLSGDGRSSDGSDDGSDGGSTPRENPLQGLITWRTRVMSIYHVATGEHLAYGSSFRTERDMRIAVVPVGYGYGYTRLLSNNGRMLIRGCEAPVRGLVNMNVTLLDVTDVPGAEAGDEVVIIGGQGTARIQVASFTEKDDMLNTELMVRLPHGIPRTIIE